MKTNISHNLLVGEYDCYPYSKAGWSLRRIRRPSKAPGLQLRNLNGDLFPKNKLKILGPNFYQYSLIKAPNYCTNIIRNALISCMRLQFNKALNYEILMKIYFKKKN